MNYIKLLTEAFEERYKATATIDAIKKLMVERGKNRVLKKYCGHVINRHGLKYQLADAHIWVIQNDDMGVQVNIGVYFFCISVTAAKQKKAVSEAKQHLKDFGQLPGTKRTPPLWFDMNYLIRPEQTLNGPIDLDFKSESDIRKW